MVSILEFILNIFVAVFLLILWGYLPKQNKLLVFIPLTVGIIIIDYMLIFKFILSIFGLLIIMKGITN